MSDAPGSDEGLESMSGVLGSVVRHDFIRTTKECGIMFDFVRYCSAGYWRLHFVDNGILRVSVDCKQELLPIDQSEAMNFQG